MTVKRSRAFAIAVVLTILFCLCGCDMSLAPFSIQNNETKVIHKVYVAGAVENEGYYYVTEGTARRDVIAQAGVLAQTVLPDGIDEFITKDTEIYLDYSENDVTRSPINVNGMFVIYNIPVEGVDANIIEIISNYINQNGKITDRETLKLVLGERYQNNFYKFFVGAEDYAAAD